MEPLVAKQKEWAEMMGKSWLPKGAALWDYRNACQLRCCLYLQQV